MGFLTDYFFIKAFIALLFTGLACGIIGTWVYLLNIPFVGVAMAHAAFAGAILGLSVGINPVLSAALLCVASSFFIGPAAEKGGFSPNIFMGILFSFMLALAFLLIAKTGISSYEALSLMWGNVLIVSVKDIYFLAAVTFVIFAFFLVFKKWITAVVYDREVALACGIPEKFIFYSLLILCALTVSFNIRTVGGLLIYGLITIPPAAASRFANNLSSLYVLSSIFSVFSCAAGLFASYFFDLPVGASVIIIASVIFALSFLLKKMIAGKQ
ncbi:MAG: metal ABC transporter permease [Endomicrobia bacterium]|nr:metal ABC transporter permease [Endomicrobiia bacterium]MCL2799186.1 metal ABC transporter permease [Endomicrobiia bacterium]